MVGTNQIENVQNQSANDSITDQSALNADDSSAAAAGPSDSNNTTAAEADNSSSRRGAGGTNKARNNDSAKKRERTTNWSFEEKRFLLELCNRDVSIIENKRLDADLTALKNRAWVLIHRAFSREFGHERSINRLKEQWRRMKAHTRAEICDYESRLNYCGQKVADRKRPSQFTYQIWQFMQESKLLCRNEKMDRVDYKRVRLSMDDADVPAAEDEEDIRSSSVPSSEDMSIKLEPLWRNVPAVEMSGADNISPVEEPSSSSTNRPASSYLSAFANVPPSIAQQQVAVESANRSYQPPIIATAADTMPTNPIPSFVGTMQAFQFLRRALNNSGGVGGLPPTNNNDSSGPVVVSNNNGFNNAAGLSNGIGINPALASVTRDPLHHHQHLDHHQQQHHLPQQHHHHNNNGYHNNSNSAHLGPHPMDNSPHLQNQHSANGEHNSRNHNDLGSTTPTPATPMEVQYLLEMQTREHNKRMDLLQVQLDTAKHNREAAEINKMIALRNLSVAAPAPGEIQCTNPPSNMR